MHEQLILLKEEKLALLKLSGTFNHESLIQKLLPLCDQICQAAISRCVADLRDTVFTFEHFYLQDIFELIRNRNPKLIEITTVLITSMPHTTMMALLYKQQIDKAKGRAIQCSTVAYAIHQLKLGAKEKDILNILEGKGIPASK